MLADSCWLSVSQAWSGAWIGKVIGVADALQRGIEFAAAFDEAPVTLAEEGVGLGGRDCGLAERTFQIPGLHLPVLPTRVTGPDWMVRGHSLAHRPCSGWESGSCRLNSARMVCAFDAHTRKLIPPPWPHRWRRPARSPTRVQHRESPPARPPPASAWPASCCHLACPPIESIPLHRVGRPGPRSREPKF